MTSSMVLSSVSHNLSFFSAAANELLEYKETRVNMTPVQRLWLGWKKVSRVDSRCS